MSQQALAVEQLLEDIRSRAVDGLLAVAFMSPRGELIRSSLAFSAGECVAAHSENGLTASDVLRQLIQSTDVRTAKWRAVAHGAISAPKINRLASAEPLAPKWVEGVPLLLDAVSDLFGDGAIALAVARIYSECELEDTSRAFEARSSEFLAKYIGIESARKLVKRYLPK